ncbi:NlpC/P60 family protein [Aquibacillus koreensis]|uniref:NlpC/P60 family protein n=1 Tax=Aquibacillus koreensis TaxID=279446 RepID=A0A9X4AHY4_9BACI|nr:C40 family peptidase [Aquibacillus koreensis]MCT2535975.1 NlpC/P60 family protein [Aquibacillus koreensis]MDC3420431.1 NlpC/P60 family protein [Aquibacillus koreensis]
MAGKRNIVIMTTVALGLMYSFFADTVHAEVTKSQIQEQRSEIQSDIEKTEEEINQVREEMIQLNDQINRIDEAVKDNQKMIEQTTDDIDIANEEVEILREEISDLQEDIDARHDILKERAVSLQHKGGSISYLEVIMGSESFGDFIDRVSLVTTLMDADNDLMEKQEADKQVLEEKSQTIETKIHNLEDMKAELEGMQAQILDQKEQQQTLIADLEEKEKDNVDIKAELEARDQSLAIQQAELEQAERASQESQINQLSASSETTNGGISLPSTSVASGSASDLINVGKKYIGNSVYVFAGGRNAYDIAHGRFDCSGFVSWAFSQIGVNVSASTAGLSGQGKKVSVSEMKPGDIVFFNTYKTNGHVGIYVGGNQFIGSQSSTGVAIANMNDSYWGQRFTGHVRRIID